MAVNKNYCSCGCGKEIKPKSKWAMGHNPHKIKEWFDWSNVIEDYKRLKTLQKVADLYGCTLAAVAYQLRKRDADNYSKKIDWSRLLEDYADLKSVVKVARKYNCSGRAVYEKLKKSGVKISHNNKSLDSGVGIGRYGENVALYLLQGSKDMNEISVKYPYDVEWNGKKIDVKTSKPNITPNGYHYSFGAENQKCDYFLFIALDKSNFPIKLLYVPRKEIKGVSVTYTQTNKCKWNKYQMEVNENELRKAVQYAKSFT